jgi:hypothetical protein
MVVDMPGGSVGTIYAELDLDASRYTAGQQRLLQDATSTTTNIEQNFKNLGIKSAAEMDLMRAKVTNSFDMIANSSKASAQDIIRAEEAKNTKIQALNEQQFGKQTDFLDSMKSNWIAVSIVATAALLAIEKAWDKAMMGAKYQEQKGILDNLSRTYGTTATDIVDAMERASTGLVAKADLMQTALGGIARGLKPDDLTALAGAAEILGKAAGVDATSALRDLTEAMETGRTKALKPYLGTSLDLATAFDGLDTKMTVAEKSQAMLSLTVMKAAELQSQFTKEVDDSADKMERIEVKFKNATLASANFFKSLVVGIIDAPGKFADMASNVDLLTGATIKAAGATQGYNIDIDNEFAAHKKIEEILTNGKIIEAEKAKQAALRATVQAREDAKKAAEAQAKAEAEAEKTIYELTRSRIDQADKAEIESLANFKKFLAERVKEEEAVEKIIYELTLSRILQSEKADADSADAFKKAEEDKIKAAAKLAEQLPQMYRDVYKDIREYAKDSYDAETRLIDLQADKYKKAGMDQVVIAKWVADQQEKAWIKMGKSGDDFFEGIKAGYAESQRDAKTWGETGYDVFKKFSEESATAVSTVLFDAIKGNATDFSTVWQTFSNGLLKTFTDDLGQMVVAAVEKKIVLEFSAKWTDTALSVINFILNWTGYGTNTLGGTGSSPGYSIGMDPDPGGASGYAEGGAIPGGKPVWVGEKGPELLFPTGPGYVMEHGQSMAYAARNGGLYRGYAEGGVLSDLEEGNYLMSLGWVLGGPGGTGWVDPTGTAKMPDPYMTQWGLVMPHMDAPYAMSGEGGGADVNQLALRPGPGYISHSGGWFSVIPWWASLLDTGLSIASPAFRMFSGAAKFGVGALDLITGSNDKNTAYAMMALGALQGYSGYSNLGQGAGGAAAGYSATNAAIIAGAKYGIGYLLNQLFGKGGGLQIGFEGMNDSGLMAALSAGMADIAPKSNSFAFSARNGLDYVPYDNMPVITHKREAILDETDADEWRANKRNRGGNTLHFHFPNALVVDKGAVNDLAELIYPRLKKLEAWGH